VRERERGETERDGGGEQEGALRFLQERKRERDRREELREFPALLCVAALNNTHGREGKGGGRA
jgi:hypothetical protein